MSDRIGGATKIGYLGFLASNQPYRRLWYGQLVSQMGDWFDSIALYTLAYRFAGSGMAVGGVIIAQFLPTALVGPLAGVVVDRFSRKTVMIVADLLRAVLVLLFLFVRSPSTLWLIYPVLALKVAVSVFFEPARNATIPNIVRGQDLVLANTISSLTWSVMLSIGAALGGIVTDRFGPYTAIIVDALSFLLSGCFIYRADLPDTRTGNAVRGIRSGFVELFDGMRFIMRNAHVALYTFIKAGWSIGGGVLLIAPIFGREIFPIGRDGAFSMGMLYAARGVGTALGPVLARRYGGESTRFLRRMIGPAMVVMCVGYFALAYAPSLAWACLAMGFSHIGGAIVWVFSTVLLQAATPDAYRGRVFSTELSLATLILSSSVWGTGVLHDHGWSGPDLSALLGAVLILPALVFTAALWRHISEGEHHHGLAHAHEAEIQKDNEAQ